MKQRVNLYLPEYRPQLELMSLGTVVTLFVVLLLIVIGVRIGLTLQGSVDQKRLVSLQDNINQKQSLANELTQALKDRNEDPQLLAVFAGLQDTLQDKQRLKEALEDRENLKSTSFSLMLQELAQQHQDDLWLTRISITEDSMIFDGQALQPESVPQWVSRLGGTQYFSGKQFDQARVFRQERALLFTLSTSRGNEAGGQQ
ncbi:PilN domain-containing protein [Alteromonas sp. ASW11-36]|uniref:PilN domain-containing protein n=1 Tax=Alteromonas arenosi TaxID=3055817 RepID=A0ABT7SSH6_9ALTE|nr:PilN domain-containing protein [Alteromonas sp. ASW11-36]MDM7859149.1 PilN domain-containing protein [Alteromonas sp. ASW11-36]